MNNLTNKDYFEYAWRHFTVIADQRLKTFNFYIIIVAASAAATFSAFKDTRPFWVLITCGGLHIVCSVAFFLIDMRSIRLVSIPKKVLIEIESEKNWSLFRADREMQKSCWHKITSYTFAFRLAFLAQFVFGVWVVIMAFMSSHPTFPESQTKAEPSIQFQAPQINPTGAIRVTSRRGFQNNKGADHSAPLLI